MLYRVYGDRLSGNCYKIQLIMHFLELEYNWETIDILAGETETPRFLTMNPNGKIPVLEIGDGEYLWESNAILNYLAQDTSFLPESRMKRAKVLQWQFFEQYSHEPYIAVARYINKYLGLPEDRKAEYLAKQEGGHKALAVMEQQLGSTSFLVGDAISIADVSLYAYTHVADEGGFDLTPYPCIQRWINHIQSLPNYIAM